MNRMPLAICRTCDATDSNNPRFHLKERTEDYPEILADMLQELIKVDLPDAIAEKLPQYICNECTRRLLDAHDFVAQARDATELLIQQLIKDEPEEATSLPHMEPHWSTDPRIRIKMEETETDERPDTKRSAEFVGIEEKFDGDIMILKETLNDEFLNINPECNLSDDDSLDDVTLQYDMNTRKAETTLTLIDSFEVIENMADIDAVPTQLLQSEKPFKCDLCVKTFTQRFNMLSHRRTHTGEKPFKCDFCEMSFTRSDALQVHRRRHTGEKPFKCDFCEMSFRQNESLRIHRRTHTGENPYKCGFCEKTFIQRATMQSHRRTHTGRKSFKCDMCEKSFLFNSHLRTHQRIHTGEKPFKCDLCEKSFSQRIKMQNHRLTHTGQTDRNMPTGEKSFEYDLYEKTFGDSS